MALLTTNGISPDVTALTESAAACPLCSFEEPVYLFQRHGARVVRCRNCGLTRLDRQAADSEILAFYERAASSDRSEDEARLQDSFTERKAALAYVEALKRLKAARQGMLLVAAKGHPFANAAEGEGFEIKDRLDARTLEFDSLGEACYESAVVLFQLEKAANPILALQRIHKALKPGGLLLLVTPSLDSWSAQFLRNQWTEWRPENFFYFDSQTIQSSLLRGGFAQIRIARDRRYYSMQHVYSRASSSPRTLLTQMIRAACRVTPEALRRTVKVKLPASGLIVTARRAEVRQRPLLSIVMPVYNERNTFAATMDAILAKQSPGIDKEIIIVESNSTDGTRDIVLAYRERPEVRIILEDRPKGKGSAVRAGLQQARGDLIMIQDADQEYDVNDYDALLEPLCNYRRAFVLGSRHVGGWKIRKFNDQPGIAAFFNFGHLIFTALLNLMYGQRIKDPFTMYKVFRRDCLHGVKLECNRFDFDFELVIKLLRRGYVPIEIPVNYVARSFKEGKKVSALRDPLTWIRALVKYRFAALYDDREQPKDWPR